MAGTIDAAWVMLIVTVGTSTPETETVFSLGTPDVLAPAVNVTVALPVPLNALAVTNSGTIITQSVFADMVICTCSPAGANAMFVGATERYFVGVGGI